MDLNFPSDMVIMSALFFELDLADKWMDQMSDMGVEIKIQNQIQREFRQI